MAITPEEKSIPADAPTCDLVLGLIEMLSRSLVVSYTLGSKLERNLAMVVAS